ncbi:MAG TPA: EFR1 family ferrodoxin [Pseudobacteroides sp.]|uniref:EFR1 family ferrodoxin n=1 Tax=Pseudobacteroides sp. TaxID=1968840 RepID=UPI002F941A65
MQKTVGVFYFSGTGNTEIVVNLLGNEILKSGNKIEIIRIEDILKDNVYFDVNNYDLIGICYPIHAFNAPGIVYDFIKKLPRVKDKYTFIIKNAGSNFLQGGSTKIIKNKLIAKGFDLFNESLVLMPSNIFTKYPDELSKQLYLTAIKKVNRVVREILNGKMRRQKNSVFLTLFTGVASFFEGVGVPLFGRDLKVSSNCVSCSKCVKNCPRGNIRMEGLKVKFGWKCMGCLRCIYRCPNGSIKPTIFKFAVFKDGYNLQSIIENSEIKGEYITPGTKGKYKEFYNYIFNED